MFIDFPYPILKTHQLRSEINRLSALRLPFLFIINFKATEGYIIAENELNPNYIRFQTTKNTLQNIECIAAKEQLIWQTSQVSLEEYRLRFEYVQAQIHKGNSFLVNLTQPTQLKTNLSLSEIYDCGSAKYKLWLKDKFTVLSPETFIQIRNGIISSFPNEKGLSTLQYLMQKN